MTKILYSASMSVDGFIAGPGGDMSWLADYLEPNPVLDELLPEVGAIVAGNGTFGGDDPYKGTPQEGEAFGGGWSGPQFVLTHRPPDQPAPGVTFVDNLDDALARARAAAGGKYVNVLGASVAAQCLDAGALDEILVYIVPVMLGDGVRLFDAPGGNTVRLEPISVTEAPQGMNLWLRVVR
ncbi:dihydrofolate reductase family protein [Mycobacterium sp.]|uniref:dihydrofolate reductase family protein n=1 Tax=Mycobacterium sp. TaxID=1785 RepID=UPI002D597822|nr:dihydrofolate reductase family protein [Mycobacterium sp.]HZA12219.1 dihydrofolate reductase family protein [Mycobacterium sp.]